MGYFGSGQGYGWGVGPWGQTPWGGAAPATLQMLTALATSENVITVGFNLQVYYSLLSDPNDASLAFKYTVTPVATSQGYDGLAPRPVTVAQVNVSTLFLSSPTYLDLVLDRPMSPYPSQYVVTASNLFDVNQQVPLFPNPTTLTIPAVYRTLVRPNLDTKHPSRDIANPWTLQALQQGAVATNLFSLGTYVTDPSGDYAFDQGIVAWKKRIYRRLLTKPGGFVHLGEGYGVGLTTYGKKLSTAHSRHRIATQAEKQIALEPETETVRVVPLPDTKGSGILRLAILAKLRGGQNVKFVIPFPV